MYKYLIFFILIFVKTDSFSQNYISFKNALNEGSYWFYESQFDSAVVYYNKAEKFKLSFYPEEVHLFSRALWEIGDKDKSIKVLKSGGDCEFRHVCTDCRAFTDSQSRPNARPSKCNYNPYIAKWSHEEGYRTLSECGVISNENEFSIDHKRIAQINTEI